MKQYEDSFDIQDLTLLNPIMNKIDKNKLNEFTETMIVGRDLIVFDSVSSTNTKLAEIVSQKTDEGTVLISDSQTNGRGRVGRKWFSPAGYNIYLSVFFEPEIHPQYSPVFTFIASLALVEALKLFGFTPEIKWPNDILINQKKVSGVLTEMKSTGEKLDFIIVGIGLNVNMTKEIVEENLPGEIQNITSLYIENGNKFNREYVISRLINSLDKYYLKFMREGVHSIIAQWTTEWGKLNEMISIDLSGEIISGMVRKVDSNGYIYIEKSDGNLEKVIAGDAIFNSKD